MEDFPNLEITSVDREIYLAIYPFELRFEKRVYSGLLEVHGETGASALHWKTQVPESLLKIDSETFYAQIMRAFEAQELNNARYLIAHELLEKKP